MGAICDTLIYHYQWVCGFDFPSKIQNPTGLLMILSLSLPLYFFMDEERYVGESVLVFFIKLQSIISYKLW